jgi:hypothetical protein
MWQREGAERTAEATVVNLEQATKPYRYRYFRA